MSSPRYAIYFVPSAELRLGAFGAAVLGYDADQGAVAARLKLPGIGADESEQLTAEPARYGFHATLKAPFRLSPGRSMEELRASVDAFASGRGALNAGVLRVQSLADYLALKLAEPCPSIDELAADCVRAFDEFRAPLSAQERERRLKGYLSQRQIELLDRWGYPYVLDQFRFHMTLAGPLPPERREAWQRALVDAYGDLAREPLAVDSIALVLQYNAASRFHVVHRARLAR